MKPPVFEYERPDSLRAALDSLAKHGGKAKLLAGGYSLVPMLNLRAINPGRLIDVSRLTELQYIVEEFSQLRIGALTTHNTILRSSVIAANCPIMVETYRHVANHSIRNRGNEVHVVTDDHARAIARIVADDASQPGPLVGVEIFGRLVEQQHLGFT